MTARCALVGLLFGTVTAWCQLPVISSLVNSASYQPTLGNVGDIVTIFGTNLASTTAPAPSVPLPLKLGGASVTVGGVAAPLFYVSPTQINLQVPSNNGGSFVVSTSTGSSAPYDPYTATPNAWYVGGIFSTDGSGCGQGAVLNVAPDGIISLNSPANSASPGDYISIFGTGQTEILDPPIDSATPLAPFFGGDRVLGVEFDLAGLSDAIVAAWNGLAPGLVGVDQVNVQLPSTVREGCAVPIQVPYFTSSEGVTQPVTIAIHQGGRQCVDPPSAGYSLISWQKTVSTTSLNTASESDSMTALFEASPGQQAPPTPAYNEGCPGHVCGSSLPSSTILFGPSCAVPGYRSLGAGAVTIQGPSLSPTQASIVPYQQGQLGGISAYQAPLPAGTVQAGSFSVAASGGTNVGVFQSVLQIGPDVQIQTPLAGIDAFHSCGNLTINWTGGDPKSWITVGFIEQATSAYGGYQSVPVAYQTHTSNGTMTIPYPFPLTENICMTETVPVTISIEVDPDPSEIAPFSASGISLGGRATWRYLHTFQASVEVP